jgi:DNA-binding NarL/FixJ family response regulator
MDRRGSEKAGRSAYPARLQFFEPTADVQVDMGKPIRVLVVDDHEMLADALGLLFSRHPIFELVGCASDGERAVEMTIQEQPDVVLMDLDLPGMDAFRVIRKIKAVRRLTRVVAVTSFNDPAAATELLVAGACACIEKTRAVEDLLELVRRAAAGEIVLPDPDLAEVVDRLQIGIERPPVADFALRRLTARETEILEALAAGDSTPVVAERLGISPLTVESHVKSILSKLGVHSKIEAITLAWRHGPGATTRTA